MPLTPVIDSSPGGRRSGHPFLALSLAALGLMVVVVLVTGTGVDVLIIVALLAALFVVERLMSDWFAEAIGPRLGLGLLAALLLGFGIWGTSDAAPKPVRDFVSSPLSNLVGRAEGYGYTGVYVTGGARPVLSPVGRSGGASGPPSSAGGRGGGGRTGARGVTGGGAGSSLPSVIADSAKESSSAADPVEPTVDLKVEPSVPRAGDAARIVVTVRSDHGQVAGEVTVDINRIEAGRLMATDGSAAWTTTFPTGRYRLQARYLGGGRFAATRSAVVVVDVLQQ